jgi:hypothetical protein
MDVISDKRSVLLYVSIGILIPLLAALIPYGYKYLFPEYNLTFTLDSHVQVRNFNALQLTVANNGEKLEKNVEVILKKNGLEIFSKNNAELKPLVNVSPDKEYKFEESSSSFILNFGNLRPGEKFSVSVLGEGIAGPRFYKESISVRSEDNIARVDMPSEFLQIAYPVSFWSFLLFLAFGVIGGIYQDYFESKEKREARLLKEIDKLKK